MTAIILDEYLTLHMKIYGIQVLLETGKSKLDGYMINKLRIPILQHIEDDKWQNKLWDNKGNINGNNVRTYRIFKHTLEAEKDTLLLMGTLCKETMVWSAPTKNLDRTVSLYTIRK